MKQADSNRYGAAYWDNYWDTTEEATKLSPAQAFRRQLILKALALEDSARVLDIGSGQGDFALDLSRTHPTCKILGLELSEAGVEVSRKKVPGHRFLQQDLTCPHVPTPEYTSWATHAVCCEVLEHIQRPREFLVNIRPYLAPGCRLVVTVPGGPMSAFDRHIGHVKHYRQHELGELLRNAGFQIESLSGAGFPFFNLYRLTVIARGKRLIQDVAAPDPMAIPLTARMVLRTFSFLFKFNRPHSAFGWQNIAVARV